MSLGYPSFLVFECDPKDRVRGKNKYKFFTPHPSALQTPSLLAGEGKAELKN
jgi:hypothetical protein